MYNYTNIYKDKKKNKFYYISLQTSRVFSIEVFSSSILLAMNLFIVPICYAMDGLPSPLKEELEQGFTNFRGDLDGETPKGCDTTQKLFKSKMNLYFSSVCLH